VKGKLTVKQCCMYPYYWCWLIVWRGLYIQSKRADYYTSERGARKAAMKAAAKLGIKLEEVK
jgi:hypothetical protein